MAYQTGTASSLDNLFSQLMTFAASNGWTVDDNVPASGIMAMHKNSVYVSWRYDPADEDFVSMHQALNHTVSNEPGTHPDDSGNGFNGSSSHANASLDNERHVQLGNGSFPSYHFFERNSTPAYLHVVVETSTDHYRHFGMGEIGDKIGDWTGGEYAYGHIVPGGNQNIQQSALISAFWDGVFAGTTGDDERKASTMHIEGMPAQSGSSKWGQIWGTITQVVPDDSASNAKVMIQGGHRAGPVARGIGFIGAAGSESGVVPSYPIAAFYLDNAADKAFHLGFLPDVRGFNIRHFVPGTEIVIGGDTWIVFPDSQKTNDDVDDRSFNRGVMYKKVTA